MSQIKLQDIKAGDIFFEYDMGSKCKLTALENAKRVDDLLAGEHRIAGWACLATVHYPEGDKTIELFVSDECPSYLASKFYRS